MVSGYSTFLYGCGLLSTILVLKCRISDKNKEYNLLGCDALWLFQEPSLLRSVLRLLGTSTVVPSSPILVTLMMEDKRSSYKSHTA
jgi:hypothetical protein